MNIMNHLVALGILWGSVHAHQSAVTYLDDSQWGGRLGDKLMMYVKAKWVAHHYKLSFLYKPFKGSDQFMMHETERSLEEAVRSHHYTRRALLQDIPGSLDQYISLQGDILYTVHYYFNLPHWGDYQKKYDSQEVMAWSEIYEDYEFLEELKKVIAPRKQLTLDHPPKDKISVAVHIRRGGSFDHPVLSRQLYSKEDLNADEVQPAGTYSDKYWPFKFPPLQYYVDQIIRVSNGYNDAPLYVYIYTDDHNPVEMMQKIEKAVNKSNITFDCRRQTNNENSNVLEDMFSMINYDCLIRSGSNYPQIAQLLGNHRIVFYPRSFTWVGNTMVIDDVGIFMNKR